MQSLYFRFFRSSRRRVYLKSRDIYFILCSTYLMHIFRTRFFFRIWWLFTNFRFAHSLQNVFFCCCCLHLLQSLLKAGYFLFLCLCPQLWQSKQTLFNFWYCFVLSLLDCSLLVLITFTSVVEVLASLKVFNCFFADFEYSDELCYFL